MRTESWWVSGVDGGPSGGMQGGVVMGFRMGGGGVNRRGRYTLIQWSGGP